MEEYERTGNVKHLQLVREAASSIADVVVRWMSKNRPIDADVQQAVRLQAIELVNKWKPAQSRLATYLIPRLKGFYLNYTAEINNKGIGSRAVKVQHVSHEEATETTSRITEGEAHHDEIKGEDALTYESAGYTPIGLGDPFNEVDLVLMTAAAQILTPREFIVLSSYEGWYRPPKDASILAYLYAVSIEDIYYTIKQARLKLKEKYWSKCYN
jgi:hypothetical protein